MSTLWKRRLVWISAIIVLVSAVMGVIMVIADFVLVAFVYGIVDVETASGDPEAIAGAISEALVAFVLIAPFGIAQFILGIWAIKTLRKQRQAEVN
ncbi:MAG: hypothetical protein AAFY84_07080 [Pseudomonadota bacterium]